MTTVIKTLAEKIKTHKLMWSTAEPHYAVSETAIDEFVRDIVAECATAIRPALRDMISRGQACDLIRQHFEVDAGTAAETVPPHKIRLMLGHVEPSLLVEVNSDYNPTNFNFFVVNGYWYGSFDCGQVRVNDRYNDEVVANCTILSSDQDRLRGDYNDVFDNFHDVNYRAPTPESRNYSFDDMDDDIPF